MELTPQTITSLIALAAVIFGPIVSLKIARRQISASVISTNRQSWINNLRDAIADYLAKQQIATTQNHISYADKASLPRIEEIVRLNMRIDLLINPKEADHAKLSKLISEMTSTINRSTAEARDTEADKLRAQVVELSQQIFKREWERVKSGK